MPKQVVHVAIGAESCAAMIQMLIQVGAYIDGTPTGPIPLSEVMAVRRNVDAAVQVLRGATPVDLHPTQQPSDPVEPAEVSGIVETGTDD